MLREMIVDEPMSDGCMRVLEFDILSGFFGIRRQLKGVLSNCLGPWNKPPQYVYMHIKI